MSHDALIDALSGYIETGPDGTVRHYNSSGNLHRVGGPAVETKHGLQAWYRNGVCHRIDGPAIVYEDGYCRWFIDGTEVTEERVKQHISAGDSCEP